MTGDGGDGGSGRRAVDGSDRRTGLCTISNTQWPVADVLDLAADLGFDAVEVWGKEPHVGDASPARLAEVRSACEAAGLDVAVYGSYLRAGTDAYEDRWEAALDAAAALGADLLRVWAGDREFGDADETHWDRAIADLRHLADRAAERGVGITVEKHGGSLTNRAAGARRLLEAVDAPNCGLNWQPTFDLTASEVLADLEALRPWVNNVHLQAVPGPTGGDLVRCPLSEAYFDLGAVVDRLERTGFDGYYEIEFVTESVDYREAVAADLATLRAATPGS
jgi:sugar phosphate isomerase/epimerase